MLAGAADAVEAGDVRNIVCVLDASIEERMRLIVEGSIRLRLALINSKHLLVMDEHLIRQSFDDPLMHQCVKRRDPLLGVPVQAFGDEIVEGVTLAHQHLIQWL